MIYCVLETDEGFVALAASDIGLFACTLPSESAAAATSRIMQTAIGLEPADESRFGDLPDRMRAYYAGRNVGFCDVRLDLTGYGPFHVLVKLAAQQIPYGQLRTYGELAQVAGAPRAARAAGRAMANNRMPVVVPCHRVVSSSGPGGFSAGMKWKHKLLRMEGIELRQ